ncbi:MAG TPA: ATP-binding cassette domain-containing protein, partial [Nocardioides sp.]
MSGGHGHRVLFEGLDLTVAPGDVIGVVGPNGAGKSTLLSLLGGAAQPLAGSVSCAPRDAFVGLLPQEHERVPGETVARYLARRTGAAPVVACTLTSWVIHARSSWISGGEASVRSRPSRLSWSARATASWSRV